MNRILIAEAMKQSPSDALIAIGGWVRTVRHSKGGFSFIALNDGSSMGNIQVVADAALPNYEGDILHLTAGCSLWVEGVLVASKGAGQAVELQARQVRERWVEQYVASIDHGVRTSLGEGP